MMRGIIIVISIKKIFTATIHQISHIVTTADDTATIAMIVNHPGMSHMVIETLGTIDDVNDIAVENVVKAIDMIMIMVVSMVTIEERMILHQTTPSWYAILGLRSTKMR